MYEHKSWKVEELTWFKVLGVNGCVNRWDNDKMVERDRPQTSGYDMHVRIQMFGDVF